MPILNFASVGSLTKVAVLCVLLVSIAGCAEYRAIAGSRGADASDATLHDALWVICNAVPVGAIKRRFNTIEKLIQYNALCEDDAKIQI